jgi:hypothetical protein
MTIKSRKQVPNGPELAGPDPHPEKYSAREAAPSGAPSGAGVSWVAATRHDDARYPTATQY